MIINPALPPWQLVLGYMVAVSTANAFGVLVLAFLLTDDANPMAQRSRTAKKHVINRQPTTRSSIKITRDPPVSICRALALVEQWTPTDYQRYVKAEFSGYKPFDERFIKKIEAALQAAAQRPGA